MSQPFMKFFTRDWMSDVNLRLCSIAARGLWIDMLCIMHQSEPRGMLCVSEDELAVLIHSDKAQVERLVKELESRGVFSRDTDGTIFSRRMVADEGKSIEAAERGRKGGNPALVKKQPEMQQDDVEKDEVEECTTGTTEAPKLPYTNEFEEFWSAYPKKIGKGAAWRAWSKAKARPAIRDILIAVIQQAESEQWTKDGGQFIPHPSTWINQARWLDEVKEQDNRIRSKLK